MLPSNPQQVPVQLSQLSPFHTSTLKGRKMQPASSHSVYLRTGSDFRSHSSQAQPTSKIHKQKLHRSSRPLAPHHPNSEGTTWSVSRRPPGLFLFNSYQHMAMGRKLNTKTRIFSTNSVLIQLPSVHFSCCRLNQSSRVLSSQAPAGWVPLRSPLHWPSQSIPGCTVAGESERGVSPAKYLSLEQPLGDSYSRYYTTSMFHSLIGNWCQTHSSAVHSWDPCRCSTPIKVLI